MDLELLFVWNLAFVSSISWYWFVTEWTMCQNGFHCKDQMMNSVFWWSWRIACTIALGFDV